MLALSLGKRRSRCRFLRRCQFGLVSSSAVRAAASQPLNKKAMEAATVLPSLASVVPCAKGNYRRSDYQN